MKPLATTPLELESESSNIVFLVPDDVLRMPWHTGYEGGGGEKVYAEKTECSKIQSMGIFYMIVHVLFAFIK